jgi:glucose-specific phosphotransferase system IIA component
MLEKIIRMFEPKSIDILSPIEGDCLPLSRVSDPAFKNGLLGEGVAVIPVGGRVVAPYDGVVAQIFGTGHAKRLACDDQIELVIHIGIETINLNGKHFFLRVSEGQPVRRGDVLMTFDLERINSEGFDVTSPVVVCRTGKFTVVEPVFGMVDELQPIIRLRVAEKK